MTSTGPINSVGTSIAPIRDLLRVIEEMREPKEEEVLLDLERVRDIRYIQLAAEMIAHGEANARRVVVRGNES